MAVPFLDEICRHVLGGEMDQERYHVVRNHEGQYSIWAADRAVPAGWFVVGVPAIKEQCLEYIRVNWTDMAPAGLRAEEAAARGE